jgi:hypothetical protein
MRIYWPWNNLGCLGLRIGRFYADIYSRRGWGARFPFGLFINTGRRKYWVTPKGIHTER